MEELLIIKGGHIFTMEDKPLKGGFIVIKNGKIIDVKERMEIPRNALLLDASDRFIYPGFIDVHTHTGLWEEGVNIEGSDGNEATDPVTPHVRALDGVNFHDDGFKEAISSGLTTLNIMPGSANVIGGQGVAVKTIGEVLLQPSGIKMALGENPKRVYASQKKTPSTRLGNAAIMRKALQDALNYLKKKKKDKNVFDFRLEPLAGLLEGKYPAKIHCHREDDILTAIRIMKEFGVRFTIEHSTEGHFVADVLAQEGVPCALGPVITTRIKQELKFRTPETAKTYEEKGVLFAFTTDFPVIPHYGIFYTAQMAVRHGLSEETALKALTINAAKILGLEARIGSIKPGKDADIVITDKSVLDPKFMVLYTLINGKVVFQYRNTDDLFI
ncbi:MAG: amidohydrolase [candidate division WOR-3 bacterium]